MISEDQQAMQTSSKTAATGPEADTNGIPRRHLLKGATVAAATLGALALPAGASAASAPKTSVLTTASASASQPTSFLYNLEGSTPQIYPGGTNRTATSANVAELSGLSIHSMRIQPGALQELHWHTNAHELSYCLAGQGEVGIFITGGDTTVFPIVVGSTAFVPIGAAHYIRNTGPDVLHLIVGFSDEDAEHIDLSASFGFVPRALMAQTFGLHAQSFPALPQQSDQFLVNAGPIPATAPVSSPTGPYTVNLPKDVPVQNLSGGTLNSLSPQFIPALSGMTLFYLQGTPGVLREPHWHQNAAEFNYIVQGTVQIEIIPPADEPRSTFIARPGDVSFIPQNYLHYIDSVNNEPVTILVFFSNNRPAHVDLSQMMTFFPREVLAASFGSNLHIFDNIPSLSDVVLAAKV